MSRRANELVLQGLNGVSRHMNNDLPGLMHKGLAVHWFRQDLRLRDNPALLMASQHTSVMPIYIFDEHNEGEFARGAASRWWLHHSLHALNQSLRKSLSFFRGNSFDVIVELLLRHQIDAVYWNQCYEPWRLQQDRQIEDELKTRGIKTGGFNGSLLWEPEEIKNSSGQNYRVFTPFYNQGCLKAKEPRIPLKRPQFLNLARDSNQATTLDDLGLLSRHGWSQKLISHWTVGETGAQAQLKRFLENGLSNYRDGRDFPAKPHVSRLSPHLHFGEISPHQVWYAVRSESDQQNAEHFCRELGWREFSYNQLYHFPNLPKKNLQKKFDAFPWTENERLLVSWQTGQTGIPIVDAGMRELWQTGYMHNRVRMIVGSFLVKNLLLHWRHGELWFWDCLVDADLANNSASWQWIAGCGADAAPYFRIFNPVTQGLKFDPDGEYTKRYVPELKALSIKYLFCPWEAQESLLNVLGIKLGDTYPRPVVDLKESRNMALAAFQTIRSG